MRRMPSSPPHELRPRLFVLAYRMLGSRQEADDVVQDAQERWLRYGSEVRAARPWLEQVVVRLALDRLKSARARREVYVGPWLPEPVLTDDEGLRGHPVDRQSISLAFLLVLERLSALERAAFVLVESFDYTPSEVGVLLERSEAAIRQLLHRAREHVRENRPRFAPTREAHHEILSIFLDALREGDVKRLEALLVAEARAVTDGGGHAKAALQVVKGADRVARFLEGVFRQLEAGTTLQVVEINGWPTLVAISKTVVESVAQIETDGTRIYSLLGISNPEKLGALTAHTVRMSQGAALRRP